MSVFFLGFLKPQCFLSSTWLIDFTFGMRLCLWCFHPLEYTLDLLPICMDRKHTLVPSTKMSGLYQIW